MAPYSKRQSGQVMNKSGWGPLVSASWVSHCDSLIMATTVFGMPVMLKHKDNKVPVDVAPLPSQPSPPHQPSPPPPTAKCHHCDWELVSQMHGLLRMGVQHMDTLRVAQMAAQEASG